MLSLLLPARGQRSTEPPSSTRRGNSRQDSCMYCGRTGHSSNDCPSQVSRSHGAQSIRIQKSRNGSGPSGDHNYLCAVHYEFKVHLQVVGQMHEA